ncbi:MAG: ABC transporter ATP-binding protein [Lentisphaeraceae bacterium]|nr:ABC transporter ATP-binding protein [Lentisphaeraceae bacterium]
MSSLNDVAIEVSSLSKVYHLYEHPLDRLKEALSPFKKKYHKDFSALHDLSFQIRKGETVGFIGTNGAGKSTLLKILTGVLTASSGSFKVNGRVAALLELGTGFSPDISGLENVYFFGSLVGFNRSEMAEKVDEILAFADIGEFIDQPLKSYSSGMVARLAFACAVNVEPDILIVDEALSVGDARFQRKCMAKIQQFCESGTVLFVSHDIETIKKYCDHAIWLESGRVREMGIPKKVTENYIKFMYGGETLDELSEEIEVDQVEGAKSIAITEMANDFGNGDGRIISAYFSSRGKHNTMAYSGYSAELGVQIEAKRDIDSPILGYEFRNTLGEIVYGENSAWMKTDLQSFRKGEKLTIVFKFEHWPNLKAGNYGLTLGLANGVVNNHEQCHYIHEVFSIQSVPIKETSAVFSSLNTTIEVIKK